MFAQNYFCQKYRRPMTIVRLANVSICASLVLTIIACSGINNSSQSLYSEGGLTNISRNVDDLLIVDCAFPGDVRELGGAIWVTPSQPQRTTVYECRLGGGEFVLRGGRASALKVWSEKAKGGDAEAQNYMGEIFEKGLGVEPDYRAAAGWYKKAAAQGYSRAQNNLAFLYEKGLGVKKNPLEAIQFYRAAAQLEDPIALAPNDSQELQTLRERLKRQNIDQNNITKERNALRKFLSQTRLELDNTNRALQDLKKVGARTADQQAAIQQLQQQVNRFKNKAAGQIQRIEAQEKELNKLRDELQTKEKKVAFEGVDRSFFGEYHALIIGNQKYKFPLTPLKTPINDATRLERILKENYGFKTKLLLDATREQIIDSISRYIKKLKENDNLLIYYAGHGILDGRGYWQPIGAKVNSPANWISNIDVTDLLERMKSLHVLIIADSCYSGSITRASFSDLAPELSESERVKWIRIRAQKRSRTAITSGGLEPVIDWVGGEHSVFAKELLESLASNKDVLDSRALYEKIGAKVAVIADQTPEFGRISASSDENGEFYFVPLEYQARYQRKNLLNTRMALEDWIFDGTLATGLIPIGNLKDYTFSINSSNWTLN